MTLRSHFHSLVEREKKLQFKIKKHIKTYNNITSYVNQTTKTHYFYLFLYVYETELINPKHDDRTFQLCYT